MIIKGLVIIFIVLILGLVINLTEEIKKNKLNISFADSLNKLKIPVVPFYNNNTKFYFLVDTGSDNSAINEKELSNLKYKTINNLEGTVYGFDGKQIKTKFVIANLDYKGYSLSERFQVMPIDAFDNIEASDGIRIVGILGSSFLNKYKMIVDFSTLTLIRTKQ